MRTIPSPQDLEIFKLLDALKSIKTEYPPELLTRRRTAFLVQLALREKFDVKYFHPTEHTLEDEHIIEILGELKSQRAEYPSMLIAKQRTAFLDQVAQRRRVGWIETFWSAVQSKFNLASSIPLEVTNALQRSLVLVSVLVAVIAGIMFGNLNRFAGPTKPHPTQGEIAQPVPNIPHAMHEITETSCTPDSASSLCSTYGFDKDPDQESWVSKTANSWIKIDTGQTANVHMVEFNRKYLGISTGKFTVSVALPGGRYTQVYDSATDDSVGADSGSETVQVSFDPVSARYVLITVTDPGVSINGVRAFGVVPPPTSTPNQIIRDTEEPLPPTVRSSDTPLPPPPSTNTPLPPPTAVPTNTPLPPPTAVPTDTPLPPPTAVPTDTPLPPPTSAPSDTPLPPPTSAPSDTPLPPPPPTDTPFSTDTT